METNNLVLLEKIIEDMYSDKGPVSWAAQNYYKTHYATPKELRTTEREEKVDQLVARGFVILFQAALVLAGR